MCDKNRDQRCSLVFEALSHWTFWLQILSKSCLQRVVFTILESGINYEIGFISKNMRSVTHWLYGESTHTH